MKIPKHIPKNNKKNDFKQLFPYMPNEIFRMLICGNSGSGKTNLLYYMMTKPLIYFDKIYLYGKNLDQDMYKDLIEIMDEISKKVAYNILDCSNDKIEMVESMSKNSQKNIIFDDFLCEKKQKPIIDYFIQGRHKHCSVIFLSQSYFKTDRNISLNCSHFCIYDSPSNNEQILISRELGVNKKQFNKATNEPYKFLYVDKPRKLFKRNFEENI